MRMVLGKLEMMLLVEILEKGLASGYLMIVAKVFKSVFVLGNANVKLEVLNDGHGR
jgi:hypothetical protein